MIFTTSWKLSNFFKCWKICQKKEKKLLRPSSPLSNFLSFGTPKGKKTSFDRTIRKVRNWNQMWVLIDGTPCICSTVWTFKIVPNLVNLAFNSLSYIKFIFQARMTLLQSSQNMLNELYYIFYTEPFEHSKCPTLSLFFRNAWNCCKVRKNFWMNSTILYTGWTFKNNQNYPIFVN